MAHWGRSNLKRSFEPVLPRLNFVARLQRLLMKTTEQRGGFATRNAAALQLKATKNVVNTKASLHNDLQARDTGWCLALHRTRRPREPGRCLAGSVVFRRSTGKVRFRWTPLWPITKNESSMANYARCIAWL